VKQPSKGAVAWDAALAVAQDVDGCHVARAAAVGRVERELEEAHVRGVVVVGYCTGVVDAEGVDGRGEGHRVRTDEG